MRWPGSLLPTTYLPPHTQIECDRKQIYEARALNFFPNVIITCDIY